MRQTLLLALTLLLTATRLMAQPEMQNWHFGNHAAISFAGGAPTAVLGSAMFSTEGCTTVSDAQGNLQFYTNSETVWNRNHQPMPNGSNFGGNYSSTQSTIIIQNPVNAKQYYVFLVPEVALQNLVGGLRYRIVDMTADNGLGDVGPTTVLFNPGGTKLSERLTAVRHANGRDTWLMVHGFPGNTFYAFLMTPTGIVTTPVTSSIGSNQTGGGGNFNTNNSVGYLKASADGSHLAMAVRNSNFELFDFNNATGQVSNYLNLGAISGTNRCYGVEFSPDGTRLYGTTIEFNTVNQWNLAAGSPAAIVASATQVGTTTGLAGGLAKGPDGKIYVAMNNSPTLAAITNPNALGAACGFLANAVPLGGNTSEFGICNFPNSYALIVNFWTGNVSTDYLTPANWNAGYVPLVTDDVTIPAAAVRMPILSGAVAHHAFTVDNGATMTLAAGGTLTLSADLDNEGTLSGIGTLATNGTTQQAFNGQPFTLGNITVGAAGVVLGTDVSLLQVLDLTGSLNPAGHQLTLLSSATGTAMVVNHGVATVTGPATVQRYVGPAQNASLGYRHIASPVVGATVASFTTARFTPVTNPLYNSVGNTVTPFPTVYSYNQGRVNTPGATLADFDRGWLSPANTAAPLADATGYTLNMPAGETLVFTGLLHNGPYSQSFMPRGPWLQSGWYFLGNPFPAPISWTRTFAGDGSGTAAVGLDNAVYTYQSSGHYAGGYASFVNNVGVNGGTDEIALGRGFFVRTTAVGTPGYLAFTQAARLTTYANPNLQRGTGEARPLVRLALLGSSGPTDEAVAYLETGATPGFDSAFDAYKIAAGANVLGFEVGAELLGANALPPLGAAPVVLPLRIITAQAGPYTLEVRQLINFGAGTTVQLRDTQTGTLTTLHAQTRYTFTMGAQPQRGRFFLLLNPAGALATAATSLEAQVLVYPSPAHDRLWLSRPANLAAQPLTITLLNTLGQVVRRQMVPATASDASLSLAGLARGIYTVRVMSAAGSVSRRVAVE